MHQVIHSLINETATKLSRRWRGESRDDIRQELYLHCYEQDVLGDWVDDPEVDKDEYRDLVKQTRSFLWYAGERYCRKEKAARAGYQVDDESFYSAKRLQELLVWYYEVGLEERPPVGRAESVAHTTDSAETGNHLASMLDISRGLSLVAPYYEQRLRVRFGPLARYSDQQIADMAQSEIRTITGWHHDRLRQVLGDTDDKIRHRVNTALRALQRELGGANPWQRGPAPRRSRQSVA